MRGGGNDETVSTGCGSPSVLHPWMLLLHMQETALWIHRLGPLSSRGGVQISWMLLLHMQETVFVDSPADILAPVLHTTFTKMKKKNHNCVITHVLILKI